MSDQQDSTPKQSLNALICPLCGESNGCAYAEGKPHSECWCGHVSFPEGVFERIPAEKRGKSCICQQCLENYVREHE
ncbi:cysteine-rich CWC family protein [Paenibacillus polysaccharolyticus]|uniref:cysteine-rich CWC family protein n=1 Tax=Paenibacillus TaxID=44249 RepID=UPI0012B80E2B|nr:MULTISPECIES: cysteine-rich CWC family protein [Paenibacillus]MCP1132310.1 cysteine-rich CWC family protein [Paenibacillus polysaccharolyticus]